MRFRRFNEQDWLEYQGANKFDNGDEPIISSGKLILDDTSEVDVDVVFDNNCCGVHWDSPDGTENVWELVGSGISNAYFILSSALCNPLKISTLRDLKFFNVYEENSHEETCDDCGIVFPDEEAVRGFRNGKPVTICKKCFGE